ncbi:MAG TPA: dTDP-4-dehydrorhamnose reductase [Pyrinomonadaceae bacterium]|nr:dTDP-4-dehydrorhamnose reductase [Pyrinomonadaceae bacterium]
MKVVITGAGGLVGGCLARRLSSLHEVLAPRRAQLDVTDAAAVGRFIGEGRPQLVVNCAVLGVDECERDPEAARAVNAEAPRALAAAAGEVGAEFLHFSTNYVFDGEGREPYAERDATRPVNVYGRTKEEGERAALEANPHGYVVRTSWVFGAGKESFLSTAHRELAAGRGVRAISDTWASVTYVEDLASRVEEILSAGRHGLYHVVNEGVCTYEEFAREAARLAGLDGEEAARLIETVTESQIRRPARRPRYTPLRCEAAAELGLPPLRHWREALAAYVSQA